MTNWKSMFFRLVELARPEKTVNDETEIIGWATHEDGQHYPIHAAQGGGGLSGASSGGGKSSGGGSSSIGGNKPKASGEISSKSSSNYNGFLTSKYVSAGKENQVKEALAKPIQRWDEKTQSRITIPMSEFIENFSKTPGAEFYVKMPNPGLGGISPELVYQNAEMKKRGYAPSLNPIAFAYGKYLLERKKTK